MNSSNVVALAAIGVAVALGVRQYELHEEVLLVSAQVDNAKELYARTIKGCAEALGELNRPPQPYSLPPNLREPEYVPFKYDEFGNVVPDYEHPLSKCTTDTDCMEKFGGDGGPEPMRFAP